MRETVHHTEDRWKIVLSGPETGDEKKMDDLKDLMAFLILDRQKKAEEAPCCKQTLPFS